MYLKGSNILKLFTIKMDTSDIVKVNSQLMKLFG